MPVNPMDLTGRRIVVSGASSGLGHATAILLSQLGAKLLLLGRDEHRLVAAMAALSGAGHAWRQFDFNDVEGIHEFLGAEIESFGAVHGLVHSAGIEETKPLALTGAAEFESLYRINVVAAGQMLRALTRRGAVPSSGCSAVIVGSVMSHVGAPGLTAYASSKAAVLGLVRSAALELCRYLIRVNAIAPGHFASPLADRREKRLTAEQYARVAGMHPLGMGRAEDVANAIAFLIADTARWITGSCLVVDGGYTSH